jgi:hypothetical protein
MAEATRLYDLRVKTASNNDPNALYESELKLECIKPFRNPYGERMTEAQEQQLERRLTKLCQMDGNRYRIFLPRSRRSSSHLASGSR